MSENKLLKLCGPVGEAVFWIGEGGHGGEVECFQGLVKKWQLLEVLRTSVLVEKFAMLIVVM